MFHIDLGGWELVSWVNTFFLTSKATVSAVRCFQSHIARSSCSWTAIAWTVLIASSVANAPSQAKPLSQHEWYGRTGRRLVPSEVCNLHLQEFEGLLLEWQDRS